MTRCWTCWDAALGPASGTELAASPFMKSIVRCFALVLFLAFPVGCALQRDTPPVAAPEMQEVASKPPEPVTTTAASESADPYLWLEAIDDPKALDWVRAQNERTRRELASAPEFEEMRQQALSALNSQSRIPSLAYHGPWLYNLWKDEVNPRGLYRRTTLAELRKPSPEWTTVLDIDEMSRRDGKSWVFKSMECLAPAHRQCLVSLSPGGGDAVEIREFDTEKLRFIENGFFLPAAKTTVDWVDNDTLFVSADLGPESLTESGYPRIVKIWKRGTPISAAVTIHEADRKSVGASGDRLRTDSGNIDLIQESVTTWTSKVWQRVGSINHPLPLPESATIAGGLRGRLVVVPQDPWAFGNETFPAGSVVVVDPAALRAGRADAVELVVASTASSIIDTESVQVTDHGILVPMLENVRGRLVHFTPTGARGWKGESIRFPDNGSLSVMTTEDRSGDALVSFETFTSPPTLYAWRRGTADPVTILTQKPTFDGARFEVTQQWATSKDGTRIPYFVVGPKGMKRDGSNPTHIFSYGGFRNALTPSYSGSYERHYGAYGKLWLERGGVFVLANIRGGGEFGPAWHSAVLKENRYKIYEDFEAVADDLVKTGITRSERLGIEGRSQGGLLVLSTMVRRPELYGAVVGGVPLSDMKRYHEMLAGASWMAEYGDPRIPAEWEFINKYSPYQNFRAGVRYPPLFVFASTRDDRVHPGHARKTVARLQELGHPVWYYENIEGGHGGSSTNEQLSLRIALSYAHLWRNLGR